MRGRGGGEGASRCEAGCQWTGEGAKGSQRVVEVRAPGLHSHFRLSG